MFYRLVHGRVFRSPAPTPRKEITVTTEARVLKQKGAGQKEHTTLSLKDRLRVIKWLEGNKEKLLRDRPKYQSVCDDIQKELGISVTTHGLRFTAGACGVHWREVQVRSETGKVHKSHNYYRDRAIHLERQIKALKSALRSLYVRLDEQPPPEIAADWPVLLNETEEESHA